MKALMSRLFTGKDNATPDLGRVLWAWAVLHYGALMTYAVVARGMPVDPIALGTGAATILAAGGAALGMKAKTEPGD